MSEGLGDVGGAREPVQADRQVPQRGHDLRGCAGVDPGQVLGVGDIADPVQAVLDLPVPPDPGGELLGTGLVRGEVGDRVDGLGAPAAAAPGAGGDRAGLAGDPDGLGGVRELDPGGDSDDLEGADLPASVRGGGAAVRGVDLPPRERGELSAQPGLVPLDRQNPVRAAFVQVGDVLALCVESIL